MKTNIPARILAIDPLYGLTEFMDRQRNRIRQLPIRHTTGPVPDKLNTPQSAGTITAALPRRLSAHLYALESRV